MGAVVLGIAALFIMFAYSKSKWAPVEGYPLIAQFDRIDGLHEGSEVRIGGVKVGAITSLKVDPVTYRAQADFQIKDSIHVPKDTAAEVVSDGLLGSKYLALVPGGDDDMLSPGDQITHTQSAVSLESMIGKLIFNKNEDGKGAGGQGASGTDKTPSASPGGADLASLEESPSSAKDQGTKG